YDKAGQVESLRHQDGSNSSFQTLTYMYDAANRLTSLERNSTTTSYEYDAINQLTKAGTASYAYDAAGNPTHGTTIGTGNLVSEQNWAGVDMVYQYDKN